MKTLLLAAVLAALPIPALAQDEDTTDPIDAALTQCLDQPDGQSTMGMIACADQAYESWDKELNAAYAALLDGMEKDSAAALKDSQRKWVAWRDAEFAFQGGAWTEDLGTAMRVTLALARSDIVRARVLVLRSYASGS
jgi:uncharacterized protein YecT (DUF1311 family)